MTFHSQRRASSSLAAVVKCIHACIDDDDQGDGDYGIDDDDDQGDGDYGIDDDDDDNSDDIDSDDDNSSGGITMSIKSTVVSSAYIPPNSAYTLLLGV